MELLKKPLTIFHLYLKTSGKLVFNKAPMHRMYINHVLNYTKGLHHYKIVVIVNGIHPKKHLRNKNIRRRVSSVNALFIRVSCKHLA